MNEPASAGKYKKNIATATPAPELIPIIPGSANSFRVIPCNKAPDNASAIPARSVMTIRGKRTENSTNSSLNSPWPSKVGIIRLYETDEYPRPRPTPAVAIIKKEKTISKTRCFRIMEGSIMRNFALLYEQCIRRTASP